MCVCAVREWRVFGPTPPHKARRRATLIASFTQLAGVLAAPAAYYSFTIYSTHVLYDFTQKHCNYNDYIGKETNCYNIVARYDIGYAVAAT